MDRYTERPMGTPDDDATLARAFQSGNSAAFDELVVRHKDHLFNLCYWFLGDYQEANDAAQEAFIKIFRSLNKFRFKSAVSTWFYRITVNTCISRLKSLQYRQRKRTVPLDNSGTAESDDHSVRLGDESQSPAKELEKKERLTLIKKAIDSLPPDQKMVVTLRDIQGLPYDEISSATGLKLGTVKSKLARARLDLREQLREVL
jgi:RNA polymerase sigma-70 factor (ECF subfamily)